MWERYIICNIFSDLELNLYTRKEMYQISTRNGERQPFSAAYLPQALHFTIPAAVHFYVLVTRKPKRKCDVFPDEGILVYLILGSLCRLDRLCQFSGVERVWLVPLLVTFEAIWARPASASLAQQGRASAWSLQMLHSDPTSVTHAICW